MLPTSPTRRSSRSLLLCRIKLTSDVIQVALVLWYKDSNQDSSLQSAAPIYSIDARNTPLSKSKHSISAEYKERLFFDVGLKPPLLRIDPILVSDNGKFRCRVSSYTYCVRATRVKKKREKKVATLERQIAIRSRSGSRCARCLINDAGALSFAVL